MTPGFQKFWSLALKKLVHMQTRKKTSFAWIVNTQLLRICLFGKYIHKVENVDVNLSSNWWVSVLLMRTSMETLVIRDFVIPKFQVCCSTSRVWELRGWNLTIVDRQAKTAFFCINSLWAEKENGPSTFPLSKLFCFFKIRNVVWIYSRWRCSYCKVFAARSWTRCFQRLGFVKLLQPPDHLVRGRRQALPV